MSATADVAADDPARRLIEALVAGGRRIAVAESLTGGLVIADLIRIPGASAAVSGGIVAYDTAVKQSVLGVDADLLQREGAVHPEVARQMATGVARVLAVGGRAAEVAIATTGVAGPDPQDGHAPGTAYVAVAVDGEVEVRSLRLVGDRERIRAAVVRAAVDGCLELVSARDGVPR